MPRFFVDGVINDTITIIGEDARHISRALRCRVGEELVACDGKGRDYHCRIAAITEQTVELAVLSREPSAAEPPVKVTLYQACPKGDKTELIVQKSVELGVYKVVLVLTHYCVSRPDQKTMDKKLERLNKISLEAAKQSGRGIVPQIEGLLTFEETLAQLQTADKAILFYENATRSLGEVLAEKPQSLGVLVGAEGGFTPAEVETAQQAGIAICTMGPRILRCETAPLYALSAIAYHYENM